MTGWVAGAVLAALATLSVPRLLLRDTLAAAAGLEQAILASAAVAPAAIHTEVTGLAVRLETGHRLAPSLRQLADELADPTADLVVAALVLASTQQARNVSDLLGSLATTAREQASMRMRIEAGRARSRTSVRIVVGTTVTFAGLLVLLNRDYLAAYDSLTGQLVLLAIGALFALGFTALARISTVDEPARLLAVTTEGGPAGKVGIS
jgi:Flp pilus assembly protein TadB